MKPPIKKKTDHGAEGRGRKTIMTILAIILAGIAAWKIVTLSATAADGKKLVFQKNSLYHRIFVYKKGSVFSLKFGRRGRITQSKVDRRNLRRHVLEYTTLMFCGLFYEPEPKNLLVVGLGGGILPREMHHYFPQCHIDVVELDPEIKKAAKRFFSFKEGKNLKVHIEDGRVFIRRRSRQTKPQKYDLVILDAFNADYIPFHLMTKEFLEQVKAVLSDNGAVIANVFSDNRLCQSELKTFQAVYKNCQVYSGSSTSNAMIVGIGEEGKALSRKEAKERAKKLQAKHNFSFDMPRVASRLHPSPKPKGKAIVLTDDRAPVNKLRFEEPDSK
ncbi:MAG: spermidine synthase [Candidatus Brocadiia bacterium]